jgi:hypothetical protein
MVQVNVTLRVSKLIACNENHFPGVVLHSSHELKNIMKKTILSIPLALLLFAACRKTSNPTVFDLGVDMQSTFEQDNVQVLIDNQPLLDREVSTNGILGFGGSISTANTEGNHTLKVIINDSTVKSENFTQKANLYIGINYNKTTKAVTFVYSDHGFVY